MNLDNSFPLNICLGKHSLIEDEERGAELRLQTGTDWTARQTDRRSKYVLGLPCFKKLSSELRISYHGNLKW